MTPVGAKVQPTPQAPAAASWPAINLGEYGGVNVITVPFSSLAFGNITGISFISLHATFVFYPSLHLELHEGDLADEATPSSGRTSILPPKHRKGNEPQPGEHETDNQRTLNSSFWMLRTLLHRAMRL